MEIKKYKKEHFSQSTLNTKIYEFEENYLANLVKKITNINYNVNDADKLTTNIRFKTDSFDLGFFIDFVTNNRKYVEIVHLQGLDYSLRSRIQNRLSHTMSFTLKDLEIKGQENLGNFSAEICRNKIDKSYKYKGTYIFTDTFYTKAPEKINIYELKEKIVFLNKMKDESEELFEKYYKNK